MDETGGINENVKLHDAQTGTAVHQIPGVVHRYIDGGKNVKAITVSMSKEP